MLADLNLRLAFWLAWRSLARQPLVALATVLGVAIGMSVVGAILIVDHHSARSQKQIDRLDRGTRFRGVGLPEFRVRFERRNPSTPLEEHRPPSLVPTQHASALHPEMGRPGAAGEEDYQAMRLAVRLGSLLAFGVGAVIVFYTLRFSVAVRVRETSLLRCLGESRQNVAASLFLQSLGFGTVGTLAGLTAAIPLGVGLLRMGISTTGRVPVTGSGLPLLELLAMAAVSVSLSLLGVVDPIRRLLRQDIADSLNPRFLSSEVDERSFRRSGVAWILPPLLAAAYLAFRPFLRSWISVVQFFAVEVAVLLALSFATLWLVPALLRATLQPFERLLMPYLPLEALLVGRRMRLTSRSLVFTIACVALAFSLLTALHDVTAALKQEIRDWSELALAPYVFYRTSVARSPDAAAVAELLQREDLELIRMSERLRGDFPLRVVRAADVNPRRLAEGRPALEPGQITLSRSLAARSGIDVGDAVLIDDGVVARRFGVIDVDDGLGFFATTGSYVSQKLYAVVSDGNPLFADNLERTLGKYVLIRRADSAAGGPSPAQRRSLDNLYHYVAAGTDEGGGRVQEIDRDFLIFDFILLMTILLAGIGVSNNMLIQVYARRRELSVLRTIGVDRRQTIQLVFLEGLVIGVVGALLALLLGHLIGVVSVSFLDQFTLFDYHFVFSFWTSMAIALLAVLVCALSAIYPAIVAPRTSSAESLYYE